MPATNINRVVVSGNLTHDPDLRETSSGHTVCELRLANNVPVKKDGKWDSKANFFQINAWGGQGENAAKHLSKGSGIMVDGRLEWQMWEGKDGNTNSRVVIVADNIQFGARKQQSTNNEESKSDDGKSNAPADDEDINF